MTSEIKVKVPHQSIKAYFGKQRLNKILVVMTIIVVALFLGACANALPESQAPSQNEELSIQHSVEAETARYEAMADFYKSKSVQRASEIETARYEAMADFYTTKSDLSSSTFLAANPELAVVQRYRVTKNESSPVTFNVEALRETYYQDWGIEADAVDVSLTDRPADQKVTSDPVTSDAEALRETYYQDWGIEADAVDVSLTDLPTHEQATSDPVTFDAETLRETYYQDWGIEADAVDVSLTDLPTSEKVTSDPVTFDVDALRETYYEDWGIEADAVDPGTESHVSSSTTLAANPELAVVQRYAVAVTMTESEMLAANPELMVTHRYQVIKNESNQPVTFDAETLRETYYQDWGIEADTIDISPNQIAKIDWQRVHFPGR